MKIELGSSLLNIRKENFDISGNNNEYFNIELYSTGKKIEKKYIYYVLKKNNEVIEVGNLENKEENYNGGIILYQGKIIKNNSYEINMWIDNTYDKKTDNVSYEVKIKSR